jgi:two-component system, chemotaxis family, CheB/CheR fusion protein
VLLAESQPDQSKHQMAVNHPLQAKTARPGSNGQTLVAHGPPRDATPFVVVAIGASAGGLEACKKLVAALPAGSGMAFILVQHLDPTHESMMVELLAGHTSMTVLQAADNMPLQREHLYIIPPATYLSVKGGTLQLSRPQAPRGGGLPFDFLLHSLAEEYGKRAVCVVLSGTGADGSLGLVTVKKKGGLVIAQDPEEAGYGGMPCSAILTGAVDVVLPVADIPAALVRYDGRTAFPGPHADPVARERTTDWLPAIIELLRTKTVHDFSLYKRGTLQRRIERRMAMAAIDPVDMDRYLAILRSDGRELNLLAESLLINVTSFFRDPKVFEILADKIVPKLIADRTPDRPIRIWIAGCSTGEETYSLAMLLREQIAAANSKAKLQVFASDADADAVASAREGLYPHTIEADVSAERLTRFFTKDDHGYRVSPELRALVVFTVQDVLADPPFSRLDLVSCRNLLIYLRPEAQAKVVSLFHFALREGGILLLGSAETPGTIEDRFKVISKAERIYRHVGRNRPGELGSLMGAGDGVRVRTPSGHTPAPSRHVVLADLGRRLVLESYAPAAILINGNHECLFSMGPTDRYLRVPPGQPTHDLLAMARPGLRTRLRSAIQRAFLERARVVLNGGRIIHDSHGVSFSIDVHPVLSAGEELLLVCFVDAPAHDQAPGRALAT